MPAGALDGADKHAAQIDAEIVDKVTSREAVMPQRSCLADRGIHGFGEKRIVYRLANENALGLMDPDGFLPNCADDDARVRAGLARRVKRKGDGDNGDGVFETAATR